MQFRQRSTLFRALSTALRPSAATTTWPAVAAASDAFRKGKQRKGITSCLIRDTGLWRGSSRDGTRQMKQCWSETSTKATFSSLKVPPPRRPLFSASCPKRIASWSMYVKVAEMYMKAAATGVLGQLTAAAQQQWDALDPNFRHPLRSIKCLCSAATAAQKPPGGRAHTFRENATRAAPTASSTTTFKNELHPFRESAFASYTALCRIYVPADGPPGSTAAAASTAISWCPASRSSQKSHDSRFSASLGGLRGFSGAFCGQSRRSPTRSGEISRAGSVPLPAVGGAGCITSSASVLRSQGLICDMARTRGRLLCC